MELLNLVDLDTALHDPWYIPSMVVFCISIVLIIPWPIVWSVVSRQEDHFYVWMPCDDLTSPKCVRFCIPISGAFIIARVMCAIWYYDTIQACTCKWPTNAMTCWQRKWKIKQYFLIRPHVSKVRPSTWHLVGSCTHEKFQPRTASNMTITWRFEWIGFPSTGGSPTQATT